MMLLDWKILIKFTFRNKITIRMTKIHKLTQTMMKWWTFIAYRKNLQAKAHTIKILVISLYKKATKNNH
jgi:hypothetical protein